MAGGSRSCWWALDEETASGNSRSLKLMTLYRLRQTGFWGDYGRILARGLGAKRDEKTGRLMLERTGPFAPPMMFTRESCVGFVVFVIQSFRKKLESADFGELVFKPTIKKHIVAVLWETWDRQAKLPPVIPDGGEPEGYVL